MTYGGCMMQENSALKTPEKPSSRLSEVLERQHGVNPVLDFFRQKVGRLPTADEYIDTNWPDGVPEEVGDDEDEVIQALREAEEAK
jgi:hypothetical protein